MIGIFRPGMRGYFVPLAAGSVAGARELAREHVLHSFELLNSILEHVGADWAQATH